MTERSRSQESKTQQYFLVVRCRNDGEYYPIRLSSPPHSAKLTSEFTWDSPCFVHNTERDRTERHKFVPHQSQSVFVAVEDFPWDQKRMKDQAKAEARAIYEAPLKRSKVAKKKRKK